MKPYLKPGALVIWMGPFHFIGYLAGKYANQTDRNTRKVTRGYWVDPTPHIFIKGGKIVQLIRLVSIWVRVKKLYLIVLCR